MCLGNSGIQDGVMLQINSLSGKQATPDPGACPLQASHHSAAKPEQNGKRNKLEELMEKDKAAKRAKLEREKALNGAGKAGKAVNGRQDPPGCAPASQSR